MARLRRGSGFLVALDVEGDVGKIVGELLELVDGFKVGWFQFLSMGPSYVGQLLRRTRAYFLADLKLADVEHVNTYVARKLGQLGFSGLITHAVVGKRNLEALVKEAHGLNMDIFLLVSMSMGGELYDNYLAHNVAMGVEVGVDGFVAPATKPGVIRAVRELAGGGFAILSPGVGPQGARPGCAMLSGADFEIVGRAVINAPSPREALARLINEAKAPLCP